MFDAFAPLIDKIGGPRRALALLVGGVAVALIMGLSRWASQPTWVALLTNLPLESASQVTDKLQSAGVTYRLERGGADVMVAMNDLAKARVGLAKDGGMPSTGRPGLELFDQPSWGMTDFTQRINYRRALEGELERTIGKIRGIEAAQVHLVLHEGDAFGAPTRPTEASVVLTSRTALGADVVKGMAHLVASSVDGLSAERVTIVDDGGRLLSEAEDISTVAGLTSRQLTMQREYEDYLRTKAERIVGQIVGAGYMRIQVSAAMSFDRLERKTDLLDPDKQVAAAETKSEVATGTQGAGGQTSTSTTYDNSRTTEMYAAAPGSVKRLTVAVLVADRVTSAAGAKKETTQPRTAAELDQIQTLVRNAVGADTVRGDQVSVISVPFAKTEVAPAEPAPMDIGSTVRDIQRPLVGLLAVLAIIAVAFMSLKMVSAQAVSTSPVMSLPRNAAGAMMLPSAAPVPAQVGMGMRERVAGTIESQPDVAARVVRAWIKES